MGETAKVLELPNVDGCFFLDHMTVESLQNRVEQARAAIEEEEAILAGCLRRLRLRQL